MQRFSFGITLGFVVVLALALVLGLALFASGSPASATGVGGPVILGGDDLTDHGGRDTINNINFTGWLYIQKALENIGPQVTRTGHDGSVAVLGSADSTALGGDAGAAYHYAVPDAGLATAKLSGVASFHNGSVAINTFFTNLAAGTVNPAIIVTVGNGAVNDLDSTEGTALTNNAIAIAGFVNSGGGALVSRQRHHLLRLAIDSDTWSDISVWLRFLDPFVDTSGPDGVPRAHEYEHQVRPLP